MTAPSQSPTESVPVAQAVNETHRIGVEKRSNNKGRRVLIPHCSCGWVGPAARNHDGVGYLIAKQHPQATCLTPEKRRYRSRHEAERSLLSFWIGHPDQHAPIRAYECDCGVWHTTSKRARRS